VSFTDLVMLVVIAGAIYGFLLLLNEVNKRECALRDAKLRNELALIERIGGKKR
jgi:hypothetical protein